MSTFSIHTDSDLVASLQAGDQSAFESIYKKYATDLYRYARKSISLKEDCEEIVQEVFISLWDRHESLHVDSLRHYLFSMVRYKVIRYFQHNKVKKKYAEHFRLFEAVYENAHEEERDSLSLQKVIDKSLEQLPERCQVAVRLRLTENLSNGEIATRMNITKKTVETYMFKAFEHFRALHSGLYKTG
jgi:RNA polymerase sigma-70 factor (family 1)